MLLFMFGVYIWTLGLSLLSALYVKYRDISYIWNILQAGVYATPIIYPLQMVKKFYEWEIVAG